MNHPQSEGWLMRRNRWQQVALLLLVIVLLLVPSVFFVMKTRRVQEELDQARKDSVEWQQKFEAEQKRGNELAKALHQGRVSSEQPQQQPSPDEPPDEPDEANESVPPQAPAGPVFALNIVRSADPNSSRPASQIFIPRSASSIVLSLELESDSDVQSYRATISTADNRVSWVFSDLKPQSSDTLQLTLNSDLMKPNDYQLALDGLTKGGSYVPQGKYSFRVKE